MVAADSILFPTNRPTRIARWPISSSERASPPPAAPAVLPIGRCSAAVGFTDDDFDKPVIGVASLFSRHHPLQRPPRSAGGKGPRGVRAAGGVPQTFGAPTVSDGIIDGPHGNAVFARFAAKSLPTASKRSAGR